MAARKKPVELCRCPWGSTNGLSVPCDEPVLAVGRCRLCVTGDHTHHDRQIAIRAGIFSPTPWVPRDR